MWRSRLTFFKPILLDFRTFYVILSGVGLQAGTVRWIVGGSTKGAER